MSSENDDQPKDRKKSAHWTDVDTQKLIQVLLRHKDNGRTADNGFRPEVWREASGLLEGVPYMGGPKTPDACKSRWQRLQRDFKAAKDMEAYPGFTWDRTTHRLSATQETWDAAEKNMDAYKAQKIHLPCYSSLALLCPPDSSRPRVRGKGRASLAMSESGSMMSMTAVNGNGNGNGNGNSMPNGHLQPQQPINHLQHHNPQDPQQLMWGEGADEDGQGEYDTSFNLNDVTQHFIPNKRQNHFDPALLAGPAPAPQSMLPARPSSPKRQRTTLTRPTSLQPPPDPHLNY
ncbi:hypothetical protein P7C73_g6314, partial [Tremellales sp. Uapishka_1]